MDYIIGAATALVSVVVGAIIHMKAIDRKLPPPLGKAKPTSGKDVTV